jgi:hypothetical protein
VGWLCRNCVCLERVHRGRLCCPLSPLRPRAQTRGRVGSLFVNQINRVIPDRRAAHVVRERKCGWVGFAAIEFALSAFIESGCAVRSPPASPDADPGSQTKIGHANKS